MGRLLACCLAATVMMSVLGASSNAESRTINVVGKVKVNLGYDIMKQATTLAGAAASQNLICELTFVDNKNKVVYKSTLRLNTALKTLVANGYVGDFNYSFPLDKTVTSVEVAVRVCGQVGILADNTKCVKIDKSKSAKGWFGLTNKSKIDFGTITVSL